MRKVNYYSGIKYKTIACQNSMSCCYENNGTKTDDAIIVTLKK